jgi:hypothetical protein
VKSTENVSRYPAVTRHDWRTEQFSTVEVVTNLAAQLSDGMTRIGVS